MGFPAIIEDECLLALYGDGYDGDVTISSPVTLTRDMYYNNLTLAAGAALTCTGVRIRVRGTLDLSSAPAGALLSNGTDGNPAAGSTGGVGLGEYYVASMVSIGHGYGGLTGSSGGTGNGPAPPVSYPTYCFGGIRAGGGASGGAGNGTTGGGTRAACADNLIGVRIPYPEWAGLWSTSGRVGQRVVFSAHGGQAGSAGGGDSVNSGGGGGSGAQSGGTIFIAAKTIQRGSNATASIIQAIGGIGGTGGTPPAGNCGGGGGGGGGAGGAVVLIFQNILGSTITNAINLTGGNGGNGGSGVGTGSNANGGQGGGKGNLWKWDGVTLSISASGSAQVCSGQTGGTGQSGLIDL